jgi:hypothetical protein
VKTEEAQRLRAELQAQKKYTVHVSAIWPNRTWNEAVAKAEELYAMGLWYLYISDEKGEAIRQWKRENGQKVIA